MISAVLFISFFVFLILGVPIALCLGLSSVCAILYSEPHLPSLQQICIQESVNSFFLRFRSLYCPEISWQKPEFHAD